MPNLKEIAGQVAEWDDHKIVLEAGRNLDHYIPEVQEIILAEFNRRHIENSEEAAAAKSGISTKEEGEKEGKKEDTLNGVGGFLLVFVIIVILNSIGMLLQTFTYFTVPRYKLVHLLFFPHILVTVFGFITAYCIIAVKKKAVPISKIFLICILLFNLAVFFMNISVSNTAPLAAVVFSFAIWYSYFSISKRVRITLENERHPED
ncbi:MAG: DUF2569 domain-containing protein [bacterium]|nr:DUF2569 domain-containing protein [bacterium]